MHEHLTNCWNLANVVSNYQPNTYCRNRKDKGNMYIVGYGTFPNGEVGLYNLTSKKIFYNIYPLFHNQQQSIMKQMGLMKV